MGTMQDLSQARLVVFDWDGTLFDSTAVIAHCFQEACIALGEQPPSLSEAKLVIGLGFNESIARLVGTLSPEQYNVFTTAYQRSYYSNEAMVVLYEGIFDMLEGLRARKKLLAVATGKSRAGLNRVLAQGQLTRVFDATRTADETVSKPHPQMLFELLEELGVAAHEAVMVGDTSYDIDMAHAAKMSSIAVSFGAHAKEILKSARPTAFAQNVAELSSLLLG